jgi:hypothetical protein
MLTMPEAVEIPTRAPPDAEPALQSNTIPTHTLQRIHAEKFARYSLLFIVTLIGVVFFNMVKVFFVPVILQRFSQGCSIRPTNGS